MKPWSNEELLYLRSGYSNKSNKELSLVLGRSRFAVSLKGQRLGLRKLDGVRDHAISMAQKGIPKPHKGYPSKSRGVNVSRTRLRLSAEGKLNIWNKGLTKSDERVMHYVAKQHTPEHNHNVSLALTGTKRSEAFKQKCRLSRSKQVFPIKDTRIEHIMKDKLTEIGMKYLTNPTIFLSNKRFTQPDIILAEFRLAIFCDGCYWHCCPIHSPILANDKQWRRDRSINDNETNKGLLEKNWKVVRLWEHDILHNLNKCIEIIKEVAK